MSYTNQIKLTVRDLKRLRDKYNSTGDFSDRSFMNELYHGLDHIIDALSSQQLNSADHEQQCKVCGFTDENYRGGSHYCVFESRDS